MRPTPCSSRAKSEKRARLVSSLPTYHTPNSSYSTTHLLLPSTMSSKLTQQTIPSAGGFTNAQGLSSPSSHAGQTALAGEPTPITPATRSAVESAHTTLPATTSPNTIGIHSHSSAVAPQQSSSSRSTTTAGGPDLDVGGAISSRIPSLPPTDREQPNIPQVRFLMTYNSRKLNLTPSSSLVDRRRYRSAHSYRRGAQAAEHRRHRACPAARSAG